MPQACVLTVMLLANLFVGAKALAEWELGPTGVKASLRGLHACDDEVIWACGSSATVIRSSDGGSSWEACGPDGFEGIEFRSIHAWTSKRAIIASAGAPAVILRTEDGGESWLQVYKNEEEAAFFDGLRFYTPERGMAFSDPVDGRLLIVETRDGGMHWLEVEPNAIAKALEGEAGFAASNSGLYCDNLGNAWIGTGGADSQLSRVYFRAAGSRNWQAQDCPLVSGPSKGIFSISAIPSQEQSASPGQSTAQGKSTLVAVGGDYRPGENSETVACYSKDLGATWEPAKSPPPAFRSAVIGFQFPLDGETEDSIWVCTGPTGTDVSKDGIHWQAYSDRGFHVLAEGEEKVFAAGADGRFAVLAKRSLQQEVSNKSSNR